MFSSWEFDNHYELKIAHNVNDNKQNRNGNYRCSDEMVLHLKYFNVEGYITQTVH